jgi:hypothetical protein
MVPGNATWIASRLWQGSAPACKTPLGQIGFDVLVLTAVEHQLDASCFPDVRVIHAELDDSGPPPTEKELRDAHRAADEASSLWRRGARVLVTCQVGANRSGLVTALILRDALGITGSEAREMVQQARVAHTPSGPLRALSNKHFARYLDSLPKAEARRWHLAAGSSSRGREARA